MKIVDVIPLVRLPWNAPFIFTYRIADESCEVGTIVRIPFRNRDVLGAISSHSARVPRTSIKDVHAIAPYSSLPAEYIQFCEDVARATMNHPSRFIMTNVVRATQSVGAENFLPLRNNTRTSRRKLFWWQTRDERDQTTINRTKSFINKQHLLLTPTVEGAYALRQKLILHGVDCETINRRTKPSTRSLMIRKLLAGEPVTIIGQRSALFLPFTQLSAITVDDEEHPAYKQDAPPPRYHIRRVIECLERVHHPDVLFLSVSPSMETYVRYGRGVLQYAPPQSNISIVDLTSFNSSTEPFSPFVLDKIKQVIEQEKSVLVFATNRGYAPVLHCRDCRYIFRCPTCTALLAQESKIDDLQCAHCGYVETVPPLCPQCNGPRLTHLGFGEKRIMEYLRSQDIPAVMSSWRPKADRISSNDAHQGGDSIASLQNDRIIVSHLTYITASPLPSLSLIIVQNVDPLLTRASFMATERAFHTLTHLLATAREHGAELIIQTSAPDHSLFLQLHAPDSFYREEAVWRKQMHYPPFGRLISVIIPQRALRKPPLTSPPYQGGDGEVSKLKELLKKFNVEVTETVLRHRRKKPVLAFLLKIPHAKVSKDAWSGISGILKERLPGNAIIDVDPDRV